MAYVVSANQVVGGDDYFYTRCERANGEYVFSAYVTKSELQALVEGLKRLDEVLLIADGYRRHG
jgi:hypothetical protein